MSSLRASLDLFFAGLAGLIFDKPVRTIAIVLILLAAFGGQLRHLHIDPSVESFFYQTDPSLVEYMAFKDQFGRDDYVVIGIKTDSIFNTGFLTRLKRLHEELEEKVPHLYEIDSLINVRYTRGDADSLIVEDLLEEWPESKAELAALKSKTLGNPLYLNTFINETGSITTILLESELLSATAREKDEALSFTSEVRSTTTTNQLTEQERSEFVQAIQEIARGYEKDGFHVHITGSPVLARELRVTLVKESSFFISIALVLLIAFLAILFRRVSGVVIPLVIVIVSTILTFSLMALADLPFTMMSQILPVFILVVGVGDSVHILTIFFRHFNQSGDKRDSIIRSLEHSGLAILMTSVTTATGLLSFLAAEMATISQLGITGAIGVLIAFLFSVLLTPCLLSLMPLKQGKQTDISGKPGRMDRFLLSIARFSIQRRRPILVSTALMIILAGIGISNLRFAHNDLELFSEDGLFYKDSKLIDRELKGSVVMEVVLDTKKADGIKDPVFLQKLERVERRIEQMKFKDLEVGKAFSITSIVKETHRALHEDRPEFYIIPSDRATIAQELLLFESGGSEDLEKVTDSQYSKARLTVKAPFADAWRYIELIETTEKLLREQFEDAEISITGLIMLFARVLKKVISSMAKSYLIVFSVVTILMIIMIGKVRIGLASMLPNILPIFLILGIMGWMNIPVDFMNITLGSIAVGIAVDDTIHFFHHFRKGFEASGDAVKAVESTFLIAGRAMITTTIVLCFGFYIYCFSEMQSLFNYGLLLGSAILFALLADFLLAPAILTWLYPQSTPLSARSGHPSPR